MFYLAIAMTIVANVVYHIAQRSIPRDASPLGSLLATYLVAIVATLILMLFFPQAGSVRASFRKLNWASYAIGLVIVGIELGFLLAYRSGWRISVAAVTSNAAVAVMLVPIGLFAFRDRLTLANAAGLVLCLAGLALLSIR